jgi:iron(III) transport system ATP-binding protein
MLAGFVVPDSGRVWFGDEDVTRLPVHQRGVGMVFQDYALFPDRSALANVMYGLAARNVPAPEAKARALAMLERVGLATFADRSPATLSGGQRQRVAMARALVIDPKLLLLDEPLAALDVKLRVELRAMVRELQLESGITTVFVTHDQEEALALSDVVAVMDRGRIVQVGAPREIYANPVNGYAADFLGSANLIPVEGGKWKVARREEIRLGEGDLKGIVEHVEFRGSVTGYRVRTELGILHVDVWGSERIWSRGDEVALRLPPFTPLPEKS